MCLTQEKSILQCVGNMYLLQKKDRVPIANWKIQIQSNAHELNSIYFKAICNIFQMTTANSL